MAYNFSTLLPADFEDLSRDLVGRAFGVCFEAFGPGPDGGIDGRHADGGVSTVLQVKHYAGSRFTQLAATMRRERKAVDRLHPDRYVLATSRHLSSRNKAALAAIIGPALQSEADIFGQGELNSLLRVFPEIERVHERMRPTKACRAARATSGR